MLRCAAASVIAVLSLLGLVSEPRAAAPGQRGGGASCVDEQVNREKGIVRHIFTNTCSEIVELTIRNRQGGKVCEVLRMEPQRHRTFQQKAVCNTINESTGGCVCDHTLWLEERRSAR